MTQFELENEYYMTDLPLLLYNQERRVAEERTIALLSSMAPNMDKEHFGKLYRSVSGILHAEQESEDTRDMLDRGGLAALRGRLKRGD